MKQNKMMKKLDNELYIQFIESKLIKMHLYMILSVILILSLGILNIMIVTDKFNVEQSVYGKFIHKDKSIILYPNEHDGNYYEFLDTQLEEYCHYLILTDYEGFCQGGHLVK